MHDIPSRDVFAKLNEAVRAVAPETILGLTFAVDEGLSVLYQLSEGFGRYLLPVADVPEILRPQRVLLDARNRPVGYTMRRVRNAHVLCQLFNRAFRERLGIAPEAMLALVRQLQEGVRYVHERGILIVDLNEMNFLLDDRQRQILFIDVDSYQTPGFPATALMESVRDRHARAFPVPLRYLFEARQGRSSALNAGIVAASGDVIAMTDDDVRVEPQWLDAACEPHPVTSTCVNDYIRAAMGDDFTAKHFRTWGASVLAFEALADADDHVGLNTMLEPVTAADPAPGDRLEQIAIGHHRRGERHHT